MHGLVGSGRLKSGTRLRGSRCPTNGRASVLDGRSSVKNSVGSRRGTSIYASCCSCDWKSIASGRHLQPGGCVAQTEGRVGSALVAHRSEATRPQTGGLFRVVFGSRIFGITKFNLAGLATGLNLQAEMPGKLQHFRDASFMVQFFGRRYCHPYSDRHSIRFAFGGGI